MDWIDEYLKAFANTVTASSEAGWFPFNWYRLCPYIADLDFLRWQKITETVLQKNISIQELAETYQGPLTPRFEIHYMMYECKVAGVASTPGAQQVIDFLNEICRARCIEDFYGLKAAKIHRPEEVEKIVAEVAWQTVEGKDARMVGNVIMAGIHLAYAYFSDYFYSAPCFELCGPYRLANGQQLIIRKFKNFQPVEIWPQGPFPKFMGMEIFTIYDCPEIIVDQWSHISSHTNLAQALVKAAIVVDGKSIAFSDTSIIMQDLAECALHIQNHWREMNFEQIKQRMLNLRWYQLAPVMDLVDLSWQPTEQMRQRVKDRQLLPEITPEVMTGEEAKKWWTGLIDPRMISLPQSYIKPWQQPL